MVTGLLSGPTGLVFMMTVVALVHLSGPETALVLLGAALSLPGRQGLAELASSGRKAFMLSTDHIAETTVAEIARV